MKTTIDLPDSLVREVKLRALLEGKKLKDAVAELLRRGLDTPPGAEGVSSRPVVRRHPATGLPYIESLHEAAPGEEMDPYRVTEVLLEEESDHPK